MRVTPHLENCKGVGVFAHGLGGSTDGPLNLQFRQELGARGIGFIDVPLMERHDSGRGPIFVPLPLSEQAERVAEAMARANAGGKPTHFFGHSQGAWAADGFTETVRPTGLSFFLAPPVTSAGDRLRARFDADAAAIFMPAEVVEMGLAGVIRGHGRSRVALTDEYMSEIDSMADPHLLLEDLCGTLDPTILFARQDRMFPDQQEFVYSTGYDRVVYFDVADHEFSRHGKEVAEHVATLISGSLLTTAA